MNPLNLVLSLSYLETELVKKVSIFFGPRTQLYLVLRILDRQVIAQGFVVSFLERQLQILRIALALRLVVPRRIMLRSVTSFPERAPTNEASL